jgi:hypothetical protein
MWAVIPCRYGCRPDSSVVNDGIVGIAAANARSNTTLSAASASMCGDVFRAYP